jgi:hypothetical protein
MSKVLFILKRREDYSAVLHSQVGLSTGLFNSANFVNNMLVNSGVESVIEVAIDNNCIDGFVNKHKPTHVIIEALWVVPSKFEVLCKLHPDVTWIIRLHSEMPFMAGEGIAMDWIGEYSKFKNIVIGVNAPRMLNEIQMYLRHLNSWSKKETTNRVIYMPNYYPQNYKKVRRIDKKKNTIDIACFGAIRPLKNHLTQAFAAIKFAEKNGKKLRFHVNAGRIEMNGSPVLHNLKGLFDQIAANGHIMVNHDWCPHAEFLELCRKMDIGLQSSFSETFNIVGADLISQGVPLVTSPEIPWSVRVFESEPTESKHIAEKLQLAYDLNWLNVKMHQWSLTRYTSKTKKIWVKYFKSKKK